MTVYLPTTPTDFDYEDLVIAALISLGYYFEARLTLRDGSEEVLELDAIVTPTNNYRQRYIVEVKSGKWGNPDIFKLAGQVQYTANSAAWLVHLQPHGKEKGKATRQVCSVLPVECIHLTREQVLGDDAVPIFPRASDQTQRVQGVANAAWWSRMADRYAHKNFIHWAKCFGREPPAPVAAASVYQKAMDSSLLAHSPQERAMALYEAYRAAPRLIQDVAAIGGKDVRSINNEAWNTSRQMHIQYLMTLLNRSRVAIIKNAYDQILREDSKAHLIDGFPASFISGMKSLSAHPYPERVPFFFQTFTEILGGFYYPLESDDCQLVSDVTSMPIEHVDSTLSLMNEFFPLPAGWTTDMKALELRIVKCVPAYMRGVGCIYRQSVYGRGRLMGKNAWYAALYELLKKERTAPEK